MKYTRFEELPVWQSAIRLGRDVFSITKHRAFNGQGDLRNQLQRAVLSISNNIAEGFERGTTQELLTFLYIARGSAGEVRSMLLFAQEFPEFEPGGQPAGTPRRSTPRRSTPKSPISDLKSQISEPGDHDDSLKSRMAALAAQVESISRQLRAWADSLQNSDIRGQRFLDEKTLARHQQKQRATAFLRELDQLTQQSIAKSVTHQAAANEPSRQQRCAEKSR